jgi:AcrR family transcriptional regulator
LLASARGLFAGNGYENTSTASIARAAGTSESQLIKHFGGKAGLLDAVFDAGWAETAPWIEEKLAGIDSPAQRLRAIPHLLFEALDRDPELWRLLLLEGRRLRKEGPNATFTHGFNGLEALIDRTLDEARNRGELKEGLNPRALRAALLGIIESAMRDRVLAERAGKQLDASPEGVAGMAEALLDSVLAR